MCFLRWNLVCVLDNNKIQIGASVKILHELRIIDDFNEAKATNMLTF